VSPKTQQERQVENPPTVKPETRRLDQSLKAQISDGYFPERAAVSRPAFRAPCHTLAASHLNVRDSLNSTRTTRHSPRRSEQPLGHTISLINFSVLRVDPDK
jgi:hypothetical protein